MCGLSVILVEVKEGPPHTHKHTRTHLEIVVLAEKHTCRLEIPVYYLALMKVARSINDLGQVRSSLVFAYGLVIDEIRKRLRYEQVRSGGKSSMSSSTNLAGWLYSGHQSMLQ